MSRKARIALLLFGCAFACAVIIYALVLSVQELSVIW